MNGPLRLGRRGLFKVLGLSPLVAAAIVRAPALRCDADKIEALWREGKPATGRFLVRRTLNMVVPGSVLAGSFLKLAHHDTGIRLVGDNCHVVNNWLEGPG